MARSRLSNAIVEHYLKLIGEGTLTPGSQLPTESQLGETHGVGRSVVREALQALDAKGFVVVRQGSVATVAPRYRWHVLDSDFLSVHSGEEFFEQLQEARWLLEPRLAALAASNADEEAIARMEQLNLDLAMKKAPAAHAEVDIEFHETLAFASGNPILASLHGSLTSLGQRTREASASLPGAIERALVWHREILAAVKQRDPQAARAAMELHLRQVLNELRTLEDGADRSDYPGMIKSAPAPPERRTRRRKQPEDE
jgi:DNA-binding FadR family transcriptional regulator